MPDTEKPKEEGAEVPINDQSRPKAPSAERPNRLKQIRESSLIEERETIRTALENNDWVLTYAAEDLGVHKANLSSALRKYPDLLKEAKKRVRPPGRPKKTSK
jgi:transcriptional regulator with GAF, ATPase, and Fis domain